MESHPLHICEIFLRGGWTTRYPYDDVNKCNTEYEIQDLIEFIKLFKLGHILEIKGAVTVNEIKTLSEYLDYDILVPECNVYEDVPHNIHDQNYFTSDYYFYNGTEIKIGMFKNGGVSFFKGENNNSCNMSTSQRILNDVMY